MSHFALEAIPTQVPASADISQLIRSVGDRALTLLNDDNIDHIQQLRKQWAAFVTLIADRRRKSSARAEEVSRRIELRLGELLADVRVRDQSALTSNEVSVFRLMHRYRQVVEEVIASSTNARPATRNRVVLAIRWHRVERGEIELRSDRPPTPPAEIREATFARAAELIRRAEAEADARSVGGDLAVVYQRIRQALATLGAMAQTWRTTQLMDVLTEAEGITVDMLRAERQSA